MILDHLWGQENTDWGILNFSWVISIPGNSAEAKSVLLLRETSSSQVSHEYTNKTLSAWAHGPKFKKYTHKNPTHIGEKSPHWSQRKQ